MSKFTALTAFIVLAPLLAVSTPTAIIESRQVDLDSLNARFVAKGKQFWGAGTEVDILSPVAMPGVIKTEFGAVYPENSMKWDAIQPRNGEFVFTGSDSLVKWATSNGKLIRGHTFVWHSQLPSWVQAITDKSILTAVIQKHIGTIATRYAGKVQSWDVVREIFNEDGSFRNSIFYKLLGESFIKIAFTAARQADPSAKLYITDYGLDTINAKAKALVSLVSRLNSGFSTTQRVLIDGIGTEGYLPSGGTKGVYDALEFLSTATGITEVAITELSIAGAGADDYVAVVKACLSVKKCVSIISSSACDDPIRGTTNLLFDSNCKPRPAYYAVLDALA